MDDVERAEELFARVAGDHGLDGWRLHWCGDPWCQFDTQTLHVKDFDDTDKTMQSLLHEAAHALVGRGGHGPEFWALLKMMVWHYSSYYADPVGLNDHQTAMMRDYLASPAQGRWLAAHPTPESEPLKPGDPRLRVDSMGTCSRCGYFGPGPAHDCKPTPESED